jgi:regulator of RNase E activity RraA
MRLFVRPLDEQAVLIGRARTGLYVPSISSTSARIHDLGFGDADGVVIIPLERAEEVIVKALEKVRGENHTREELAQGRLLGEVYKKYGVL